MTPDAREEARGPLALSVRDAAGLAGLPGLLLAAATLVLETGTYLAARACGGGTIPATLATLAVSVGWIALAAPAIGASGRGGWSWLLRIGVLTDVSGLALLLVWGLQATEQGGVCLNLTSILKCYCIFVAVAMAAGALPRCAGRRPVRCALAGVAGGSLAALLAVPFWIGALLAGLPHGARVAAVEIAFRANPFYGITAAVAEDVGLVWHLSPVLYGVTWIGDRIPAPVPTWHAPVLLFGAVAVAAGLTAAWRKRRTPVTPA